DLRVAASSKCLTTSWPLVGAGGGRPPFTRMSIGPIILKNRVEDWLEIPESARSAVPWCEKPDRQRDVDALSGPPARSASAAGVGPRRGTTATGLSCHLCGS